MKEEVVALFTSGTKLQEILAQGELEEAAVFCSEVITKLTMKRLPWFITHFGKAAIAKLSIEERNNLLGAVLEQVSKELHGEAKARLSMGR